MLNDYNQVNGLVGRNDNHLRLARCAQSTQGGLEFRSTFPLTGSRLYTGEGNTGCVPCKSILSLGKGPADVNIRLLSAIYMCRKVQYIDTDVYGVAADSSSHHWDSELQCGEDDVALVPLFVLRVTFKSTVVSRLVMVARMAVVKSSSSEELSKSDGSDLLGELRITRYTYVTATSRLHTINAKVNCRIS